MQNANERSKESCTQKEGKEIVLNDEYEEGYRDAIKFCLFAVASTSDIEDLIAILEDELLMQTIN